MIIEFFLSVCVCECLIFCCCIFQRQGVSYAVMRNFFLFHLNFTLSHIWWTNEQEKKINSINRFIIIESCYYQKKITLSWRMMMGKKINELSKKSDNGKSITKSDVTKRMINTFVVFKLLFILYMIMWRMFSSNIFFFYFINTIISIYSNNFFSSFSHTHTHTFTNKQL